MARSEILLAFNELIQERELPPEEILKALQDALIAAYRKMTNAPSSQKVEVQIDLPKGQIVLWAEKEVVEEVDPRRRATEISLEEARKYKPDAQVGDIIMVPVTPKDFGRIATQTARQVIKQRLQETERELQYQHFRKLQGEIVHGVVQAVNNKEIVVGLEKRAEGHLPYKEQIPGERFRNHDRIRALLLEVKKTPRGPYIILSRAHQNFLRRLLEEEVPEIQRGEVEIRAIAREAGRRSKIAVSAIAPNIDAVGACIGIRGSRIQAIMRELNNEKIDIIEWDPNPAVFIAKALSPARVKGVYLQEGEGPRTAMVVVSEDQLSQAIGKEGQNVRLAAKLTRWRIDIKSIIEAAEGALQKLYRSEDYADILEEEGETIRQVEALLERKRQGRSLTPEEYDFLFQFIDRVERGILAQIRARRQAEAEAEARLRAGIPDEAFEQSLDVLNLSPRLTMLLTDAGYTTVGDLIVQLRRDKDAILILDGVGPRAMSELERAVDAYLKAHQPEPVEAEAAADVEAEPEATAGALEAPTEPVEAMPEAEPEAEAVPMTTAEPDEEEAPQAEVPSEPAAAEVDALAAEVQSDETAEPEAWAPPMPEDSLIVAETQPAEDEDVSLDELFAADQIFESAAELVDEIEDEEEEMPRPKPRKSKKKKKAKKKPKRYVELDYVDGQDDVLFARRKRKRDSEDDWDW
ncbi:MAG: transcription termination/antitermination protein NusA [Chloroflexi bacterium]|nr:transcription termination/antitermination protein NusA [Chloroflexota bacterium]